MRPKKQTGGDDKARLSAIRAERDQLLDRVWRAEKMIERDRKQIGQLNQLIAKSDEKS